MPTENKEVLQTMSPTQLITEETQTTETSTVSVDVGLKKKNIVSIKPKAADIPSGAPETVTDVKEESIPTEQINVNINRNKVDVIVPESTGDEDEVVEEKEAAFMHNYINDYIKYTSTPFYNRELSIKKFATIITYAVNNQHKPVVLNIIYKFFKEHKNTILRAETALQGIRSLPPATRAKVETAYMLLYMVTHGEKIIDYNYAAEILGSSGFVSFIMNKNR